MKVIGASLKSKNIGEHAYFERLKRYLQSAGIKRAVLVRITVPNALEHDSINKFNGESLDGIRIEHLDVDLSSFYEEKQSFLDRAMNSADLSVKVKLVEVIEESINSYLETFWEYPEKVNSDLTDSIFKAKHALISDLIYEYEKISWMGPNNAIIDRIKKYYPENDLAVLVDPERRYYIREKLGSTG